MEILPALKENRIVGASYFTKDERIVIWDGTILRCQHNRQSSKCKDCGGGSICEHGKERCKCKHCGGGSICEHDKIRSSCVNCKGGSICNHRKIRSKCKQCMGGSICGHGKERNRCIRCGGGSICIHNILKSVCKHCGGGSICSHKRQRSLCKQCGGGCICKHGNVRSRCKQCGGASICIHMRLRANCKLCFGGNICMHNKRKEYCKPCGGSALCKSEWCETSARKKYDKYCLSCYVNNPENKDKPIVKNYKTKERHVADYIKETFPNYDWICDKKIQDGCSLRRPDLMLDLLTHVIIVEVDENQHSEYNNLCNNLRTMQISQDLAHRPVVFIRFNPDEYIINGEKVPSCFYINKGGICVISNKKMEQWNKRLQILKEEIIKYINIDICSLKTIQNVYLFYNN